jgi:sterol desaturase/sphingolipid hydroxylase (fatty acid hydroxylase superfamily)
MVAFTSEGKKTLLIFTAAYALVMLGFYYANFGGLSEFLSHPNPAQAQKELYDKVPFLLSVPGFPWLLQWIFANRVALFECGPKYGVSSGIFGATLPTVFYWTTAYIISLFDLTFEAEGKLKQKKNAHPGFTPKLNHYLYRKAIYWALGIVVFSWIVHPLLFNPLMNIFYGGLMCAADTPTFPTDLVGLAILGAKLYGMYLITDVIFYTTHRMCHEIPYLYKNVHKIHHQWVETYAIDAAAAHPFEMLVVNLTTVELPAMIVGAPYYIHLAWMCAASINTVCNHSGYNLLGTVAHDQHHHYNNCEFGTNTFVDWLCKTTFEDRNPTIAAQRLADEAKLKKQK